MIPVSMSRKTPSFGQLSAYMDSEKSDSRYDLHHNYFVRGRENIAGAFYENSKALKSRRNGNYLYHEILSITLEEGVELRHAKECLREIALKYIADRCPRNMVYACLHEDHRDHLHYHLMISANEKGEAKRHWLTTKQFDTLKRNLETHVLENYSELKQRKIITADPKCSLAGEKEKRFSRKAAAQKRRTGKLERQEAVRETIFRAMTHTPSLAAFKEKLKTQGFEYYQRGKHHGVTVTHDDGKVQKYRFATIGAAEAFEEYLKALASLKFAEDIPEAPKGAVGREEASGTREATQDASERPDAATDTEDRQSGPESDEKPFEERKPQNEGESVSGEREAAEETPEASRASETLKEMREHRTERAEWKREKALSRLKRKGKPR